MSGTRGWLEVATVPLFLDADKTMHVTRTNDIRRWVYCMVGGIEIIGVLEYGASPLINHNSNATPLQLESDERWHAPDLTNTR